jgi:molybdopterin synthase sulfur carrier subunit
MSKERDMAVRVQIPGPLRALTGGAAEVEVEAGDVAALIEGLESRHPGLKDRLCDASGNLRTYVRLFVNDEDVRFLQSKATPLKPGDTVSIVPAIAGGSSS